MPEGTMIAAHFTACLERAVAGTHPFRHWLLEAVLPEATCRQIDVLPVQPPRITDTLGKRETHNSMRLFLGLAAQADFQVCRDLASALQSAPVVRRLEALCNTTLSGGFLRIEYCLDTDGFWLEPHTDIGAKLFTMLIYLSDDPGSEAWGTDLLDAQGKLVRTAPYQRNCGLIFIPAQDTWHGFHPRPIQGVRRSLIVNYVKPEWRSRHELAFPDRVVGGGA
jgi:hypothetical protein